METRVSYGQPAQEWGRVIVVKRGAALRLFGSVIFRSLVFSIVRGSLGFDLRQREHAYICVSK